jgi:hypothetical protein
MRDGVETLDIVVRGDGYGLNVTGVQLDPAQVVLTGILIDPEIRTPTGIAAPISTTIRVAASELIAGAHIARETEWILESDDGDFSRVSWIVEPLELPDGYALQDARVTGSDGRELRAFAIEDLAATVGVGLVAATGAVFLWLKDKQTKETRRSAEEQFKECLDSGRAASLEFDAKDEVSVDSAGRLSLKTGASYKVRCE